MKENTAECVLCFEEATKLKVCLSCNQTSCVECTRKWRDHQLKEELIPSCPFCRHKEKSHETAVVSLRNSTPVPNRPNIQKCLLTVLILLILSLPLSELYFSKEGVMYTYLSVVCLLVIGFCYYSDVLKCQEDDEGYEDYAV